MMNADLKTFQDFATSVDNTLIRELSEESTKYPTIFSREVRNAHFTLVDPTPVKQPRLILYSSEVAELIGLDPKECESDEFLETLSGNFLPGKMRGWATVYGCHCYGHWFGQLGDGRAISIAEVFHRGQRLELQLKGAGRTPYSRQFDGRAVLRSSLREFLASEAMFHLGVPTTRALCLISHAEEVSRPWYPNTVRAAQALESASDKKEGSDRRTGLNRKFPPTMMKVEQGAVLCRVAPSFLRFGHFELFWRRGEMDELRQLADHCLRREYPQLDGGGGDGLDRAERYVVMFEEMARRQARLVAEWLRVGYVQGNMNSDNTAAGGVTVDYGPFGFMERLDPSWNPFTSDADGKFAFISQHRAAAMNLAVLSNAFAALVRHTLRPGSGSSTAAAGADEGEEALVRRVEAAAAAGFAAEFTAAHAVNCGRKLGLLDRQRAAVLWGGLISCADDSQARPAPARRSPDTNGRALARGNAPRAHPTEGAAAARAHSRRARAKAPPRSLRWFRWVSRRGPWRARATARGQARARGVR